MSDKFRNNSSNINNKKSRMKYLSLLDSRSFERLRYVVLPASIFILFIGGVLFLFALNTAFRAVCETFQVILVGEHPSDAVSMGLIVHFLEIISDLLKAVVFFIIGVGIYSIFIVPLNLARSLDIATFDDLEDRVIGVVVIVMAIEFLERFIQWQKPVEMLQFAGAMGLVVAALAIFLRFRSYAGQHQNLHNQLKIHNSKNEDKPGFKK